MAVKVYVLVRTDPGRTRQVISALQEVPGIVEIHEVLGPYDIVAEIEVDELRDVSQTLMERIRTLDGIESTTSLVAPWT
jgi:DNA-binding Lrp family transcriptional regulator